MTRVRCAIYTRKSSEEGLEQDFNSLDAQHEACAAYVASQASEGWQLLPVRYDDGGLSGGTLERPALKRLLADIGQGAIDIVVLYKIDRLTRSLLDFARLVEAFDAAGTSFVSVTQSFNTTTSMGRLTLNMLLSFAQFEREVTAERIRDKVAASKARGMWMGGAPPMGYRPKGRSLAIIEADAKIVATIYERYLALGNVRLVCEELAARAITTPRRRTAAGRAYGGRPFSHGHLYRILANPVYAGDIAHKGRVYPGNHRAIIERATWEAVQALLARNAKGRHRPHRAGNASVLAGRLVDEAGEPLVAAHTTKKGKRYRYYVSRRLQHGVRSADGNGMRIPAAEIEGLVAREIAQALADPLALADRAGLVVAPADLKALTAQCASEAAALHAGEPALVPELTARITTGERAVTIVLDTSALARRLGLPRTPAGPATLELIAHVRLTRTGRAVQLVEAGGAPAGAGEPDAALIRLVLRARRWWDELCKARLTPTELAAREGVTSSYLLRVVRLAFLSPKVLEAILEGTLCAGIDSTALTAPGAIEADWMRQERRLLVR
ncbi:hypothetical protein GCM10011371_34850 [Novosphingobium marinum]|uniref:DNA invertase Pin-like site-specific DNA recombinase n=1 Tax=Novosphingobium marinum TaxID=1514948 RepID=A0A7Y9XYX8_9SPHN|nr:recombinase family protein [Novosphingobium marinum]NYH97182.1 DNA invertase Pin-like site-specific DNA recombinase [Novosphingobium marinum]GGC44447.1 hypothetical protein GCM10011371_34850 [Novosphingobium marinum]